MPIRRLSAFSVSLPLLFLPFFLFLAIDATAKIYPERSQRNVDSSNLDQPHFVYDVERSLSVPLALTTTATYSTPAAPTYIKGLYMTYHAAGHEGLRTHALDLIEQTELNALVLDIKGDLGVLTYKSEVITATAIGANDAPTITDWEAFMQEMQERDIYTIARIVVFKDNYLARAHPEWAVKDGAGNLWFDGEDLPWLEPFHEEVWDYNIALAVEAAKRGFDEVQFDYIRFPTDGRIGNIAYAQPADTPEARTKAIMGLLAKADAALAPYPTKLAADVFGYTTWYEGDFQIGQDLSLMAAHLDVISPMLYPSTYSYGLPGMPAYDFAVAYPYQVVYQSMLRGLSRVKGVNPNIIVRPWIQDFPDYAFDGRIYTPQEIRAQMEAAYDTGGGGWLLWDPRVRYTPEALASSQSVVPPNELGEIMILRYENFGPEDNAETRSAAGFRQDLEQLWAAGYYPLNLRDLGAGQPGYIQDVANLAETGWVAFESPAEVRRGLNHVPAGKRPVVLTFDGSHISQYKLLPDGSLDPESALGVLYKFHQEHPADWPLRATFFVQPEAADPAYQLFGQPELAAQKLQMLVDDGLEIGLYYDLNAADFSDAVIISRKLREKRALVETTGGEAVSSLALSFGPYTISSSVIWNNLQNTLAVDYSLIAVREGWPTLSPYDPRFTPQNLSRLRATPATVKKWLDFYERHPDVYYSASGRLYVSTP